MNMYDLMLIIPAVLTAYVLSYISMPAIVKLAELKNLIDTPDGDRKIRDKMIPTLGGIGIFSAFIISFSVWGQAVSLYSFPFFIAALFILFLMGVRDDIVELNPLKKLLVQLVAVSILVYGGEVAFTGFGGVFGIGEVSWLTGSITTVIVMLAIINAYNLIDGIDGLAGGVGVIVSGIFGIWFWGAGFLSYALLSFALSGALTGFLVYNMFPAKIFMGDTGAMSVGFILGFLAIEFLTSNQGLAGQPWHISNGEALAVSILIIPIADTIRVIILRLIKGISPFKADRNHIHHNILDMGIKHHHAAFILWLFNILVIGLAYLTLSLNINLQLLIILVAGMLILPVVRIVAWFSQNILNINIEKPKSETAKASYDAN